MLTSMSIIIARYSGYRNGGLRGNWGERSCFT
jgi:hypothetical protein